MRLSNKEICILLRYNAQEFTPLSVAHSSVRSLPFCSMLEPVRKHFASGEPAKLLEAVKRYRVTR